MKAMLEYIDVKLNKLKINYTTLCDRFLHDFYLIIVIYVLFLALPKKDDNLYKCIISLNNIYFFLMKIDSRI